eukprot:1692171-Rhodomonas_salina.1
MPEYFKQILRARPFTGQPSMRGAISPEDLEYYCSSLPARKSPGSDTIPYKFIKHAPAPLRAMIVV